MKSSGQMQKYREKGIWITPGQHERIVRRAEGGDTSAAEILRVAVERYAAGKAWAAADIREENTVKLKAIIDNEVWDKALARAKAEGRNLSAAIRELLP